MRRYGRLRREKQYGYGLFGSGGGGTERRNAGRRTERRNNGGCFRNGQNSRQRFRFRRFRSICGRLGRRRRPFVLMLASAAITRTEHATARDSGGIERQRESSLSPTMWTMRKRRTTTASETARPHRARRMTTDWNSSFMSPDPQLERVHRDLAFHAQALRSARNNAGDVPVGVEACRRNHAGENISIYGTRRLV